MNPFAKMILWIGITSSCTLTAFGQNSAPSAHFNFGKNITGDISICEVRIPANGVAFSTYYETLGFRGNKNNSTGNGYAGIQKSHDRRGSDIHIFSIWHAIDDPSDTKNFPYPAYLGYGTKAEHFGGEGVGLKTWNFKLKWQPDVWYTHLIRVWDVGKDTHYGFFVRDGSTGIWRHLSTIGVKEPTIKIKGPNDSFLEDWTASGKNMREIHLRNIWRRDQKEQWHPTQSGSYSPNRGDLKPGKRSHNFKNNWNAGTRSDNTGDYYFMTSGGNDTRPTPPLKYPDQLRHSFSIKNPNTQPSYPKVKIENVRLANIDTKLSVSWDVTNTGLPQFSYHIGIFDNAQCSGDPLIKKSVVGPELRQHTVDLSNIKKTPLYLQIKVTDLFDQVTQGVIHKIPVSKTP